MATPYELFTDALEEAGLEGTSTYRGGWMFQCPAHDDDKASLSVDEGQDGRPLFYCFAGCDATEVLKALGLSWSDVFNGGDRIAVAEYVYVSAGGDPLIRVTRYQPKGFTQERWADGVWLSGIKDTQRVPYNLPMVNDAVTAGRTVYITEGEKDADTLCALGYTATTFLGGAGKWRDEYARWFKHADVVITADADDAGRAGATRIAEQLRPVAKDVTVVVPAAGKDVTDHIRAGLEVKDLLPEGDGLDEFGPLDWDAYTVERGSWLLEPYVPRGGRVLAFGPAGSLKSLWAMWLGAHVAMDGGRVAYFSLEMQPSMTARRLKRLNPPKENFVCFTRDFRLGSPSHTEKLLRGLRDYDLIVVDSWTAARAGMRDSNEQVSELDTTFFLPIIRLTGAAVMVIDNTGHAAITDKGVVKPEHARGASAKGDKMDVTILFDRPLETNNYLTRLTVKKMRYDRPWPPPVEMYTPPDIIEFYYSDSRKPVWPGLDVLEDKPERTVYDEVAEARLRDRFGAMKGA